MFFIFGISTGEKKLENIQTSLCKQCEQYGRLELYMTYYYFTLFFIPLFRWNRKFYVKSSCCNSIYSIDKDLGKRIYKGETVILTDDDLILHSSSNPTKTCSNCNYQSSKEYLYCPKCGSKL